MVSDTSSTFTLSLCSELSPSSKPASPSVGGRSSPAAIAASRTALVRLLLGAATPPDSSDEDSDDERVINGRLRPRGLPPLPWEQVVKETDADGFDDYEDEQIDEGGQVVSAIAALRALAQHVRERRGEEAH